MKRIVFVAMLAVVLLAAGEVIAADPIIDQPDAGSLPVDAVHGGEPLGVKLVVIALAAGSLALCFGRRWNRLAAVPARPVVMKPPVALALFIAFLILGQAGVSIAANVWGIDLAAENRSLHDTARLTVGAYLGQSIALASVVFIHVGGSRSVRGIQPNFGKSVLIGVGAFALAWPVVIAAGYAARALIGFIRGESPNPVAHQTLKLLVENPVDGWYIALAAMVVLVAPVMEEVIYRGLVQATLVQMGVKRWPAILITSAAFTAMHIGAVEPHALAVLFALSIGFGWAYERTGRLATPIVMHALFNAANLVMARWLM